jgi:orotidine-5'-phosphate decarboxylase
MPESALPGFRLRLADAISVRGPLCVGVDPSSELLTGWGLPDDVTGLRTFALRCVEVFAPIVPALKPQVAFFERHGAAGFAVLEELLAAARGAGLLVVADAKRSDIENTCAAYAQAWLTDGSPLAADALTATPYLGLGALDPLFDAAEASGRGVFVVVRSSNPEGRPLQEALTAEGRRIEDDLLESIAARNAQTGAPGALGAVIGATLEPSAFALGELGGPILVPGMGAQGATPPDVVRRMAGCAPGSVLVNVARSVLRAGPRPDALRAAALEARAGLEPLWA